MLDEINVNINTIMQIKQIAKYKLKLNKQIFEPHNKKYIQILFNYYNES